MIKRNEKGILVDNPHVVDKTNERYGRLLVLGIDLDKASRKTYWKCKCDCGEVKSVRSDSLGVTQSCGCLKKEQDFLNLKLGEKQLHGLTNHPAYHRWVAMMGRCYNPKTERFPRYGARGIKVCKEWHDVKTFIQWAEDNGFDAELTLERVNLNGDYEPENCKWITPEEQRFNTSYNVWHEYKGKRMTTMQWQRFLNIPLSKVTNYRSKGIDFQDLIKEYYKDNPEVTN